jgi:hypothetical protein
MSPLSISRAQFDYLLLELEIRVKIVPGTDCKEKTVCWTVVKRKRKKQMAERMKGTKKKK